MKLFELRACWEEYYDCPDNGKTKVCDAYETIKFSMGDDTALNAIAEDLAAGFKGGYWSERRADQLRRAYPGYDCHRDTEYKIVDVSDTVLEPPGSEDRE